LITAQEPGKNHNALLAICLGEPAQEGCCQTQEGSIREGSGAIGQSQQGAGGLEAQALTSVPACLEGMDGMQSLIAQVLI
jgi:hypothetical protein